MSIRIESQVLDSEIVNPPAQRACEDQSFELPTGLYAAMAVLLFGFLAVLAVGLAAPGLIVPMGINFVFLTAFFSIPAIFVGSAHYKTGSLSWSKFMKRGVQTETGHSTGRDAALLVLTLPALIFCWAIAIVTIWALV